MPKIPDDCLPVPIRPLVPPDVRLERALVAVLQRIGMIGKIAPNRERLLAIAWDYANYRPALADDQGNPVTIRITMKDVLGKPNPLIDNDIPF